MQKLMILSQITKNAIVLLMVFLLSVVFMSGCEGSGRSTTGNDTYGSGEENNSFVAKCNQIHNEWLICTRRAFSFSVKEIARCRSNYNINLVKVLNLLTAEQIEQRHDAHLPMLNASNPTENISACQAKATQEEQTVCLVEFKLAIRKKVFCTPPEIVIQ